MKVVRVIPCLDVAEGRVVKGVNFVDLKDAGDPIELAKLYDSQGADELVFLDIKASHENRETTVSMAKAVAEAIYIPFTIGGGVASVEQARSLLRAGADKVAVNSAAVKRPELISEIAAEFGSQCCVVAIDARRKQSENQDSGDVQPKSDQQSLRMSASARPAGEGSLPAGALSQEPEEFEICTHGGRKSAEIDLLFWAKKVVELGAGEILLNSIDRDGTRLGFDHEMTSLVTNAVNVPVIASGGVGSVADLAPGVQLGGADAVLAASIFHYGEATIAEAKSALTAAGVTVRPI